MYRLRLLMWQDDDDDDDDDDDELYLRVKSIYLMKLIEDTK